MDGWSKKKKDLGGGCCPLEKLKSELEKVSGERETSLSRQVSVTG